MRRGLVALMLLAACGGGGADPVDGAAALDALAARQPPALDPAHRTHDVAGHDVWGPVLEPTLDPATAAALEEQWQAAVDAADDLQTPEDAVDAGYRAASAELPGIGAHYVRWDLVDAPFDPARPSMLLYDRSDVRPDRLAGLSYWVRSDGVPPEGFAGDADPWHMHHGLCFVDGFLQDEGVAAAADCPGDWLAGTDLWMAHAWVAPAVANPWGRFAPRNPALCPGAAEPVADFARCPDPLPTEPTGAELDANELICSLPTRP